MRFEMVQHEQSLSPNSISNIAARLDLDVTSFAECLASGTHDAGIRADIAEAQDIGIAGTPGFVIGRTSHRPEMTGFIVAGALPYSTFESDLSALLATVTK
jgi:predicted DsbA family dithiol-disulfide isomerase